MRKRGGGGEEADWGTGVGGEQVVVRGVGAGWVEVMSGDGSVIPQGVSAESVRDHCRSWERGRGERGPRGGVLCGLEPEQD